MFLFGSKKLCLPGWLKKHQLGAKDKNVINAWAVRLTLDARLRGDDGSRADTKHSINAHEGSNTR